MVCCRRPAGVQWSPRKCIAHSWHERAVVGRCATAAANPAGAAVMPQLRIVFHRSAGAADGLAAQNLLLPSCWRGARLSLMVQPIDGTAARLLGRPR